MVRPLLLVPLLFACGKTDEPADPVLPDPVEVPDPDPRVLLDTTTIFLTVGQQLTLTASTVDGEDAGYTWASSDAAVATVVGGVVTGHTEGEVLVTATGDDSGAVGEIGLYVAWEYPHQDAWMASAHGDVASRAFTNWDADGAVPASCARCHSTSGLRDYLGDDGTDPHVVDGTAPTGEGVRCMACHNPAAAALDHVIFPSGAQIDGLGPDAICMTCHQGRSSKDTVDAALAAAEADADDAVNTALGFSNIHYYAAGATLMGGRARGGYQYDLVDGVKPLYDVRFRHVEGYDSCTGCHDPHSLEVRVQQCASCHDGVSTKADIRDVRMQASAFADYDGDGDRSEGLYHEVQGLRALLYDAIQAYALTTADADAICWSSSGHPYYFIDTDGSGGPCDAGEAVPANRYATWTPRLLRAAYNYQVASKDPGAYVHNGKYIIQLLHDGITDLNSSMAAPVVFSGDRDDPGHFDGASRSFRNWDTSAQITASCSRCHGGASGFLFHTTFGVNVQVLETPNGLDCTTCHPQAYFADPNTPALVSVSQVDFTGGATIPSSAMFQPSDAVCATCHSGRQGTDSIDQYLASSPSTLSFRNVHYLPAAAVRYGSEARMGYQYAGHDYVGARGHMPANANSQCTFCHDPTDTRHTFRVEERFSFCINCHSTAGSVEEIRWFGNTVDYDGDGDVAETLLAELSSFQEAALHAMRAHVLDGGGDPPCYNGSSWYKGADAWCTPAEAVSANAFTAWDAELIKAAHNVHLVQKDRGAWAHNIEYAMQLLYDSVEALGGDPGTLSRP